VPRQQHLLPGREVGKDLLLQLTRSRLQGFDLAPYLPRQPRALLEFFESAFQIDDGALEIEHRSFPVFSFLCGMSGCHPVSDRVRGQEIYVKRNVGSSKPHG